MAGFDPTHSVRIDLPRGSVIAGGEERHVLLSCAALNDLVLVAGTEAATAVGRALGNSIGARAAARLNHPNIVSVTDFGIDERRGYFLVMELLEGASLDTVIRRAGVLRPLAVLRRTPSFRGMTMLALERLAARLTETEVPEIVAAVSRGVAEALRCFAAAERAERAPLATTAIPDPTFRTRRCRQARASVADVTYRQFVEQRVVRCQRPRT